MILKSIILGIVQGLTEFLPVSSSGHLAVLENYLGISEPVTLATFLHFGTFIATVVFFFKPIVGIFKGLLKGEKESVCYTRNILIGTIPVVIFALIFKTQIEETFHHTTTVALLLGITGGILALTSVIKKKAKKITFISAIIIGFSQMLAVFPGISRSGITISTGLFLKVKPEEAFRFSFLLSLPAVLGANLLEIRNITTTGNVPSLIIGMLCSFMSGLVALKILKNMVHKRFHLFGIYCLIISVILLIIK